MFKRILVANRGEIALRIVRAARELGIETIAVHSKEDESALHVLLATDSVCIGPAAATESYLNQPAIIAAAIGKGAQAVHPGYGFLAENADFARLCKENGLKFIGPAPEVIEKMGHKQAARSLMIGADVPVVPGTDLVDSLKEGAVLATQLGFPVLIKAAAGGGGRGMRTARSSEEFIKQFEIARTEAINAFGNGDMYIEKLIENPKHIEFQILADCFGNCIHLGERECSVQRRNQKLIEEAPSKAISPQMRKKMGEAAVSAAKAAGYTNAGTVEFILDAGGSFYFIEMNTRIQVEHPITEEITGIDIVKEQIRIAAGLPLLIKQKDIKFSGCSIECRINAEDPAQDFAPCPAKIDFLHLPLGPGIRIESAVYQGLKVSPYYDSLLAKIIVHAPTRLGAIRKMRRALEEIMIGGVENTAPLLHLIMYHPDFVRGDYNTSFIERNLKLLISTLENSVAAESQRSGGAD